MGIPYNQGDSLVPEGGHKDPGAIFDAKGNLIYEVEIKVVGQPGEWVKVQKNLDKINKYAKDHPIEPEMDLDTKEAEKAAEEYARKFTRTMANAGKKVNEELNKGLTKPLKDQSVKSAAAAGAAAGKEYQKNFTKETEQQLQQRTLIRYSSGNKADAERKAREEAKKVVATAKDTSIDLLQPAVDGVLKAVKSQIGRDMEAVFQTAEIQESILGLGRRITEILGKAIQDAFNPKKYSLEGHPLENQIQNIIDTTDKQLATPLKELFNLDKITADKVSSFLKDGGIEGFANTIKGISEDTQKATDAIHGLSKNDKKMLGLINQDKLVISDRASSTIATQNKKTEEARRRLIEQQVKTQAAKEKEALSNAAFNDYQKIRDENKERKEEERLRKAEEKARQQRQMRLGLFERNVSTGIGMAQEAQSETNDLQERKLLDDYYRSIQRIAGIHQSAVVHGRVENPQTIYAGISELQKRSAAITNVNLSKQFGITELNENLKTTQQRTARIFAAFNRVASVVENINNAFATVRNVTNQITHSITSFTRNILSRLTNQIRQITQSAISAYQSLQTSMIGFSHFFGEDQTEQLTQQIKSIAAKAPGLDTVGLAEYVRQIAPVSNNDSNLALNAALGMLKTIQYGGAQGSTEMEYVIKNVRDVLAKGTATQIDLRQFNRAMPILEKVLADIGESQLIKDGKLNITKDNVNTILSAFARLNIDKNSPVAGIYDEINQTLGGQWEQFTEQFRTNVMEVFESSGIFGQLTRLLREFNAGEYAQTALIRFGKTLKNMVDNINWFKVQEVAKSLWEDVKIIGEGIKDALNTIRKAIGGGNETVIQSFSKWIADIFRGLGDGIAQVVRFVKYIESTGIVNSVSRLVGWMGSAGATLVSAFSQFTMNMIKMIGNAGQLYTHIKNLELNSQLKELQTQMDAIPMSLRSATVTKEDILNGQGVASSSYSPETTALENLTQVVNRHFQETESLIKENVAIAKGEKYYDKSEWLPEITTGISRSGKRVVHTVNKNGKLGREHNIGVYNEETGQYDWEVYNSGNTKLDNNLAEARYQALLARNRLQESSNPLLNKIGSSKIYNKITDAIDSISEKLVTFLRGVINGFFKAGVVMTITEALNAFLASFNAFGDATVYVTGVIKTAGLTIAGTILGSSTGIPGGGVIGALVGLGVGISSLIETIKNEEDKLTNTTFNKKLTEGQQNVLNAATKGLIKSGYLSEKVTERSDEEAYALQQMANVIANTGMSELAGRLEKDPEYLYRIFADNLVYKTIGMNATGQNTGQGFNWNNYKAAAGKGVDIQTDRKLMGRMADLISKYDLTANQRWYRDENGNYYHDENLTSAVSGEEIWKAYFGDQEITKQGIDKFEDYIKDQEKKYSTLKDVDAKTEDVKNSITKLTGNTAETFLDNTTEAVLNEVKKANATLLVLAGKNPTGATNAGLYGTDDTDQALILSQGDTYDSRMGKGLYDKAIGLRTSVVNGPFASANVHYSKSAKGLGFDWPTEYNWNTIFHKVNQLLNVVDDEFRPSVEKVANDLRNRNLANDTAESYMDWIDDLRQQIGWLFKKYGLQGFASGGSVLSRGIDTVPAMLAPGEFVMKQSAVRKAGLGVMYALNHGDLGMAARRLAGNVSNNWYRNNNAQINNSRNQKTNINNIVINNRNNSGRLNSYYSLANRLSF